MIESNDALEIAYVSLPVRSRIAGRVLKQFPWLVVEPSYVTEHKEALEGLFAFL